MSASTSTSTSSDNKNHSSRKNINAKTKNDDATTTQISIFKRSFIRHKRRGNDPNRIDDLLLPGSNPIIDVKRIHRRHQNQTSQSQSQSQRRIQTQTKEKTEHQPTKNHDDDDDDDDDNDDDDDDDDDDGDGDGDDDDDDDGDGDGDDDEKGKPDVDYEIDPKKSSYSDRGKDLVFLVDHTTRADDLPANDAADKPDSKSVADDISLRRSVTPPCCYGFHEYPGVYIYPNALSEEVQLQLSYEAVTKYCEHSSNSNSNSNSNSSSSSLPNASPNAYRTNIDLLAPKTNERINNTDTNTSETMWNLWKQEQEQPDSSSSSTSPPPTKKKKTATTTTATPTVASTTNCNNYYRRFTKLSWSTMGYHYDWNKRQYHPDQKLILIPPLVTKISKYFASASLLYNNNNNIDNYLLTKTKRTPTQPTTDENISFIPSASIVNYYTEKSNFGGHRDDLEHIDAMDKPIVSISTGLSAVFILGGHKIKDEYEDENEDNDKKNDHPHPVRAILIRPGDVLIMGGPSRLNYHAVARIVPHEAIIKYDDTIFGNRADDENNGNNNRTNTNTNDNAITLEQLSRIYDDDGTNNNDTNINININDSSSSDEKEYLKRYLKDHRININVRQVYPDQN